MKTFIILALCALALSNMSCTDKDRIIAAVQNGKELPYGSNVPFLLSQNYPNPFEGATTIMFSLRSPLHVRLRVMNEDWVTVTTLIDTVKPAGVYQVNWLAGESPSGEYLAVMDGGGVTEAIRMRIIK